jgi:hypothetical protein
VRLTRALFLKHAVLLQARHEYSFATIVRLLGFVELLLANCLQTLASLSNCLGSWRRYFPKSLLLLVSYI